MKTEVGLRVPEKKSKKKNSRGSNTVQERERMIQGKNVRGGEEYLDWAVRLKGFVRGLIGSA